MTKWNEIVKNTSLFERLMTVAMEKQKLQAKGRRIKSVNWPDLPLHPDYNRHYCFVCGEPIQQTRWDFVCSLECHERLRWHLAVMKWHVIRKGILLRDHFRCKLCGRCYDASFLDVDHIVPIAKGGHPFDFDNLQTLCKECHLKKTQEENNESE